MIMGHSGAPSQLKARTIPQQHRNNQVRSLSLSLTHTHAYTHTHTHAQTPHTYVQTPNTHTQEITNHKIEVGTYNCFLVFFKTSILQKSNIHCTYFADILYAQIHYTHLLNSMITRHTSDKMYSTTFNTLETLSEKNKNRTKNCDMKDLWRGKLEGQQL